MRFRRRDYLGDPASPLDRAVRDAGRAPDGRAARRARSALLTQLRSFGHCFNPVSFYYCFDAAGEQLEAVVAEVTNTPWGERHAYVLARERRGTGARRQLRTRRCTCRRSWGWIIATRARVPTPGATLSVHIESREHGDVAFDATLALRRARADAARRLARVTARYPLATLRVLALIYGHALALKLAGVPVHPHPQAGTA